MLSLGDTYSFNAYSINVRGIPLDDYNGYKINGLPFFMTTVELPLESFESVQLLKGASGFMYGFGAPGGIINFVSKKPTDKPTLSLDAGYRSDGVFSEHLDAGGRVGGEDRYGYRLNLTHEQGETYNGARVLRNAESLSVDARLTPTLTWSADAVYQSRKVEGGVQDFMLDSYSGSALPKAPSGRKNLSAAYADTFFYSDVYFLESGLQWKIDPVWTANLDVSRSQDHRRYSGQWMGLDNEAGDYTVYLNKSQGVALYEQAQAKLEGNFNAGGLQHQLVLGLAWQGLSKHTVPKYLYTAIGSENLYSAITPLSWDGSYDDTQQYRNYRSTQKSAFVSDTLQWAQHWSLLAGARYTDYQQTSYKTSGAATPYAKKPVTPTLALMYRPRHELLLYGSYVGALEDGGTAGTSYANANESLAPIKSRQYELGAKWEGRGWGASAALYEIDRGAQYGNAQNVYVSDGQLRIRGLELNGQAELGSGLKLSGSTAWSAGKYRETEADLVGKRLEGVPRLQASLQLSARVAAVEGLSARAETQYFGAMAADALNQYTLPSTTLVNAGLSYQTQLASHPVTLRAGLDNVFNRSYWGFLASGYLFVGAPRTLSLNARIEL